MSLSRNDLNLIIFDEEAIKEFNRKMEDFFIIAEMAYINKQLYKNTKKNKEKNRRKNERKVLGFSFFAYKLPSIMDK